MCSKAYHSVIKKTGSHGFLKLGLRGCMLHMKSPSLVLGEWSGDDVRLRGKICLQRLLQQVN